MEYHELASFHNSFVYSESLFPSVKSTVWTSPECVPTIHDYRCLCIKKKGELVRTNKHFVKPSIFIRYWFEPDPLVDS